MSMPSSSTPGDRVVPPAVRLSDLEYRYPDGREALRGVSLQIGEGESVALVGPNGAGKSTLLLHLNGLLPGKARDAVAHHHGVGLTSWKAKGSPHVWIDGMEVNARNALQV